MAQYANVNFNTHIKEADLIKTVLIKNPAPENINPVKTLDDFVKDILKDKKKQKDLDFQNFQKFKFEIDKLWFNYRRFVLQLNLPDYPKRIQ